MPVAFVAARVHLHMPNIHGMPRVPLEVKAVARLQPALIRVVAVRLIDYRPLAPVVDLRGGVGADVDARCRPDARPHRAGAVQIAPLRRVPRLIVGFPEKIHPVSALRVAVFAFAALHVPRRQLPQRFRIHRCHFYLSPFVLSSAASPPDCPSSPARSSAAMQKPAAAAAGTIQIKCKIFTPPPPPRCGCRRIPSRRRTIPPGT